MAEIYGLDDELPPDVGDTVLDDEKPATADNVDTEDGV